MSKMQKQIISKLQMFMMLTMLSCGFILPVFSFTHISGSLYPILILCAAVLSLLVFLPVKYMYEKGNALQTAFKPFNILMQFAVLLFFTTIIFVCFYMAVDFWIIYDYRQSNFWLYVIFIALVVYICSFFGIEVVARLSFWMFAVFLILVLIDFELLRPMMDISRLLPIQFEINMENAEQVFLILSFLLPALLIVLIFGNNMRGILKKKNVLLPVLLGIFTILLIIVRTELVLGKTSSLYAYSLIQTLKLIRFPGALAGVELVGVLVTMAVNIFYIVALNCALSYILRMIFPKLNNKISCAIPVLIVLAAYFGVYKIPSNILQFYFSKILIIGGGIVLILIIINYFLPKRRKTL